MTIDQLKPNKVLHGPIFPEPVQVIVTIPMGEAVKIVAKGVNTMRVYELLKHDTARADGFSNAKANYMPDRSQC